MRLNVVCLSRADGIALDTSTFTSNGFLTVQNNTIAGIDARASSVALFGMQSGPVPGGINAIINNGGNGIFAHAGTTADLIGKNSVTGNTLNAALAFQSSTINTSGSPGLETTFANNTRGGVAMIFNSGGRLVHAIVRSERDSVRRRIERADGLEEVEVT